MNVQYELTPQDLWRYQWFYYLGKNRARNWIMIPLFVACLGAGLYILLTWQTEHFAKLILFLGPVVAFPAIIGYSVRVQAKNLYGRYTMEILPERLSFIAPNGESQLKWSLIQEAYETKHAFYLFFNERAALTVSKREMSAGEAAQLLEALQAQYLEAVGRPLPMNRKQKGARRWLSGNVVWLIAVFLTTVAVSYFLNR